MPQFGRGKRGRRRLAVPPPSVGRRQASNKNYECDAHGKEHEDAIVHSAWRRRMLAGNVCLLCGGGMRYAAQVTHKSHAPRGGVPVHHGIDHGTVQHTEERVEDPQHQCRQHRQTKAVRCGVRLQVRWSVVTGDIRQCTLHDCALYHKVDAVKWHEGGGPRCSQERAFLASPSIAPLA